MLPGVVDAGGNIVLPPALVVVAVGWFCRASCPGVPGRAAGWSLGRRRWSMLPRSSLVRGVVLPGWGRCCRVLGCLGSCVLVAGRVLVVAAAAWLLAVVCWLVACWPAAGVLAGVLLAAGSGWVVVDAAPRAGWLAGCCLWGRWLLLCGRRAGLWSLAGLLVRCCRCWFGRGLCWSCFLSSAVVGCRWLSLVGCVSVACPLLLLKEGA